VFIGQYDTSTNKSVYPLQIYAPNLRSQIRAHLQYDPTTGANDIAIVKISPDLILSTTIKTIDLPALSNISYQGPVMVTHALECNIQSIYP
jgi:hypothetical protein